MEQTTLIKDRNSGNYLPKYYQLKQSIIQQIENKQLEHQVPSEKELVSLYQVGRMTVRRVINELVSEGYLYTIQGKGTFVKPEDQRHHHDPLQVQMKQINIFVPTIEEIGVGPTLIHVIEKVAFENGYQAVVSNTENNLTKLETYVRHIIENNVPAGFIFIPLKSGPGDSLNLDFINRVQAHNLPIVVVDSLPYYEESNLDKFFMQPILDKCAGLDYVVTDHEKGGYLVTSHLIELGHKKIAYIGGSWSQSALSRSNGYRRALIDNNLVFEPNLIYRDDGLYSWLETKEFIGYLHMLKENKVTAIFAEHDLIATHILAGLQKAGIKVPDEMSLVGYDDMDYTEHLSVPLTTVRQPVHEEGRIAAEILIDKLENKNKQPKQVVLPVELVIRKSTAINVTTDEHR
jgi:GntR family transcriptional regulator of arabinose operon